MSRPIRAARCLDQLVPEARPRLRDPCPRKQELTDGSARLLLECMAGWALILPQMLLVFTFFYWPAGEALYWAFTLEPAFGGSNQWVGWQNFTTVFADARYWNSVQVSVVFALSTTALAMVLGLILAMFVDRQLPATRSTASSIFCPMRLRRPRSASPSASSSRPMPALSPPSTNGSRPLEPGL